jgi:membrane-associated phospholipid phosphatase
MKQTIAKCLSLGGHPLLTIPLFVIITMFATENTGKAALVILLVVGGIFVPLIAWLYIKSKNGTTTNFDVSDRKQRKSLFVFILPVLMLVTIILYYTGQSKTVCLSVFFGLVITFVSQLVNLRVKSSLHVSMTIYLAFLIMPLNYIAGIIVLLLSVLIGWSRIVLGRHTLKEVLWGGGIGLTIGLIMFYVEQRI